MNKLQKDLFLVLFPFYPLLAWAFHFVNPMPLGFYLNMVLVPLALYHLANTGMKMPRYLQFFGVFVIYHVCSTFITNTMPLGQSKFVFALTDYNVFAFALFVIVENTWFDEGFIERMNKNIFLIVIVSLIVSLIQVKQPMFFFNTAIDVTLFVGDEDIRISSIYSWVNLNSGGITFPILIAILLNFHETGKRTFIVIILCGIVVAFLTKARYTMISTIIAFSQLIFSGRVSFKKIFSLIFIFAASIYFIVFIAGQIGFDIESVISGRILEKDSEMGSAKARVTSYEVFSQKFPEHPILGVGPATKQDVLDLLGDDIPLIHVGYLSYLYFYGVVGCFFFFGALFLLLKAAWRVGKRYNFWGSFYGLLSFCIANATLVYFNLSEMGIVLTVIYVRYYTTAFAEAAEEINEEELATSNI
jgi:O-Antigen ligase